MTWNYRLVQYADNAGYGLHEVYYNKAGEPTDRTSDPIGFVGDTPEEVIKSMEVALKDAKERPLLPDNVKWGEYDLPDEDMLYEGSPA